MFYSLPVCLSGLSVCLSVNRDVLVKEEEELCLPLFKSHLALKTCRVPRLCQEMNPRLAVLVYLHSFPMTQEYSK